VRIEAITAIQLAVLERLTALPVIAEFYLAGGTALALRHGHRRSIDFDFFRSDAFDTDALNRLLALTFDEFSNLPGDADTLYALLSGVTTSFFHYPYSSLESPIKSGPGLRLASDRDIAAMKIEAVARRGSRKDFVDLRILCHTGLTLDDVFNDFDRKYGTQRSDRYHRLRALTFFDDAEREPMPDMLVSFDWDEARRFFTAEATRMLGDLTTE
jgi:hypothetical protein